MASRYGWNLCLKSPNFYIFPHLYCFLGFKLRNIVTVISILVLTFSVVNAQGISNESLFIPDNVFFKYVANPFVESYHVEYFELVNLDKDKDFKYIFECNGKEYEIYPFFMYKNRPIFTRVIFLKEGIAFEFTPQNYFPIPKENSFESRNESINEFSNKMFNSGKWLCLGHFSNDEYGGRFKNILTQEEITQEIRFVYYHVLLNKSIENLAKEIANYDYEEDSKTIYNIKIRQKNEPILNIWLPFRTSNETLKFMKKIRQKDPELLSNPDYIDVAYLIAHIDHEIYNNLSYDLGAFNKDYEKLIEKNKKLRLFPILEQKKEISTKIKNALSKLLKGIFGFYKQWVIAFISILLIAFFLSVWETRKIKGAKNKIDHIKNEILRKVKRIKDFY